MHHFYLRPEATGSGNNVIGFMNRCRLKKYGTEYAKVTGF